MLFLITMALADDAPDKSGAGSGSIRLGGGAGVADVGGAVRLGVEGEQWVLSRLGLGLRGGFGIDGLNDGRQMILGEVLVPLRVLGNDSLALVLAPGIGIAHLAAYRTQASADEEDVGITVDTTDRGLTSSASLGANLYGRLGFLAMAVGPRYETYGFRTSTLTLQLTVGLGW